MLILGVVATGFVMIRGTVLGQEFSTQPSMPSSESIIRWKAYCYDAWSLAFLNCQFTYNSTKGTYDGGHTHDFGRPIGGFRYREGEEPITTFSFSSMNSVISFQYLAPEVSGDITLNMSVAVPYPYICIANCLWERMLHVEVYGLQPMPESGIGAWRLTGQTASHPDSHYGTSSTKTRIAAMATDYFEETGIAIEINDMSLVRGGLFDWKATWAPPHHWHRVGKSVDVDHLGVKERLLNKIAKKYQGKRYEVDLIHYEFP